MATSHIIKVRSRKIYVTGPSVVANGIEADTIDLDLDADWRDLDVVIILGSGPDALKVEYEGHPISIPSELLEETGPLPISVVGYAGTTRVTTQKADCLLRVVASGIVDGDDPLPEVPDLLSQLLDAKNQALEAADQIDKKLEEAYSGIDEKTDQAIKDLTDQTEKAIETLNFKVDEMIVKMESAIEKANEAVATIDQKIDDLKSYVDNDTLVLGPRTTVIDGGGEDV